MEAVESHVSWHSLYTGFCRRLLSSWLACSLLAFLAFFPLAGIALLSPDSSDLFEQHLFTWCGLALARLISPLAAVLIVFYLARKDGAIKNTISLATAVRYFLDAVGLTIAVWSFTALASLFFLLPGVAFLLGCTIALPVLIIEHTSMPEAVRRSWERTRYVRDSLFIFWLIFIVIALLVLVAVVLVSTGSHPALLLSQPLRESPAFLPIIVAGSFIYSALISACFEVYRQLDVLSFDAPPQSSAELV